MQPPVRFIVWRLAWLIPMAAMWCGCALFPPELVGRTPPGMPLAVSSQPLATIVIPDDPPAPVRFAADELKHYLDRMTGGSFRIVEGEPPDRICILLGEELAAKAGIDVSRTTRDGYRIATENGRLYIAGRDSRSDRSRIIFTARDGPLPAGASRQDRIRAHGDVAWDFERGTLYGVYHLLEYCGVRWFFPGPEGEVVPRSETIQLPPVNGLFEPYYYLRVDGPVGTTGDGGLDGRAQRLWMMRMRASSTWMAFGERPRRHQWYERFARGNPEYFAADADGSRHLDAGPSGNWHLNYTHEGVFRETVLDATAYFTRTRAVSRDLVEDPVFAPNGGWDPDASYASTFSLLPNANLRADSSPASQALVHDERPAGGRQAEYVWQFVDRVASQVGPRLPGKYFTCLARDAWLEPPPSLRELPPGVIVGVTGGTGFATVPETAGRGRLKELLGLAARWDERAMPPLLFSLPWHYRSGQPGRAGVPMHLPHHAAELIRGLAKHGRFMYMEHDLDNPVFDHLNRYLVYRLLWKPDADIEAVLTDYYLSFYGPAAAPMQEFFSGMEAQCQAIAQTGATTEAIWERHFSAGAMDGFRQLLDDAAALAGGTPHAAAVTLIRQHWLGAMQAARDRYLASVSR